MALFRCLTPQNCGVPTLPGNQRRIAGVEVRADRLRFEPDESRVFKAHPDPACPHAISVHRNDETLPMDVARPSRLAAV